jgi:hypothetical protein
VGADHAHLEVRVADVVADVLAAHQREEEAVVGDERREAGGGEAGGDADHVALGDAGVEVALGVLPAEVVDLGRPAEVGGQDDDVVAPPVGELDQDVAGRQLLREVERADHVPGLLVEVRGHGGAVVAQRPEPGCGGGGGHRAGPSSISA